MKVRYNSLRQVTFHPPATIFIRTCIIFRFFSILLLPELWHVLGRLLFFSLFFFFFWCWYRFCLFSPFSSPGRPSKNRKEKGFEGRDKKKKKKNEKGSIRGAYLVPLPCYYLSFLSISPTSTSHYGGRAATAAPFPPTCAQF